MGADRLSASVRSFAGILSKTSAFLAGIRAQLVTSSNQETGEGVRRTYSMDLEDPQFSTAAQESPILDPNPDASCDTYMSDGGSAGAQAPGRRGVRRAEPRSPGRVARSDEETEQDETSATTGQDIEAADVVEAERARIKR